MDVLKLQKEFNSLKDDVEKWKWVKEHQETGIIIYLDNDDTTGYLPDPNDPDDAIAFQFSNFIGWDDGVVDLLEAFGIRAEGV